ncbi:MAG: hypothetical protein GY757_43970, partial [bacterium]|nr:hypothetical protein [bacterium]
NLGVKPYTFSYGHPQSPDVVCGRKLAAACDLEYHNHYVQPTADWFGGLAEEILDKGNTITHLHRAHRLDAFKMEVGMHPGVEMMVGGYMGGESIRNFFYDNLIVSEFVKAWIHGDGDKRALIKETLAKKFIKESEVDIEEIYNYLNGQRFLSKSDAGCDYSRAKMSEFFMTFSLLAGTHHSQDPNLLSHFIKYPVQVYL